MIFNVEEAHDSIFHLDANKAIDGDDDAALCTELFLGNLHHVHPILRVDRRETLVLTVH
jgi:hypothetical protein